MNSVRRILDEAGYDRNLADALFPDGISQVAMEISKYLDREMKENLDAINIENLRIRDRVKTGVEARLHAMQPHKEALQMLTCYWLKPWSSGYAGKALWSTADIIWDYAGDTSKDYNHYTKRSLLCGVLASTYLYWLQDDSPDRIKTVSFLDRRIENVLQLGKVMGRFKKSA